MSDKRNFRLTINLTKDEYEVILLAAACSNESPGKFARKLISEMVEKDKSAIEADKEPNE